MRILFITGCLEFGHDGVGDYTRRLAQALSDKGHLVGLISINDRYSLTPQREIQQLHILRLPHLKSINYQKQAATFIDTFHPDCISLQFVPYAYHPKGFCFNLAQWLQPWLKKIPFHVMVHELWIGPHTSACLKDKWVGYIQKASMLPIFKQAACMHTHTHAYQYLLAQSDIHAQILPLFTSIPIHQPDEENLLKRIAEKGSQRIDLNHTWLVGLFGTIHPEWSPQKLYLDMQQQAHHHQKALLLIGFGLCSPKIWHQMQPPFPAISIGFLDNQDLSQCLQAIDFALTSTPIALIEKSSSVATWLDHGVPVIMDRHDIHFKGFQLPTAQQLGCHIWEPSKVDFKALKHHLRMDRLDAVANTFLNDLHTIT